MKDSELIMRHGLECLLERPRMQLWLKAPTRPLFFGTHQNMSGVGQARLLEPVKTPKLTLDEDGLGQVVLAAVSRALNLKKSKNDDTHIRYMTFA